MVGAEPAPGSQLPKKKEDQPPALAPNQRHWLQVVLTIFRLLTRRSPYSCWPDAFSTHPLVEKTQRPPGVAESVRLLPLSSTSWLHHCFLAGMTASGCIS
jgi:hypothetical protein